MSRFHIDKQTHNTVAKYYKTYTVINNVFAAITTTSRPAAWHILLWNFMEPICGTGLVVTEATAPLGAIAEPPLNGTVDIEMLFSPFSTPLLLSFI